VDGPRHRAGVRRTPAAGVPGAHGRSRSVLTRIAAVLLTCAPSGADAADPVDPFALDPELLFAATVISATKTDETWWDTPAAVYIVSNEDIARSGATSIPEALRLVPGVNVARVNASGWAVSVRGFNGNLANKLLVLIDGRTVYNSLFSGVYWDVQDTLFEDVERIEVIRGPGATLWGSNAVNGVINVITKTASATQGGLVSGLAGNEEGIGAVRYGGAAPGGGHYRVFAKYVKRDDQRAIGGGNGEDAWSAGRGGFRADWGQEGGRDRLMLQGDGYYSDHDAFRPIPLLAPPFARVDREGRTAAGGDLLGRWTRDLAGGARASVQGYVDYTFRDLGILENEHLAFDLDAQYQRALASWNELVVGARFRYDLDDLTGSPQATFRDAERGDVLVSGFFQDRIALAETCFLTLGSKLEHNDYTGVEVQPGVRIQWQPGRRHVLWGSVARAVRTPSRIEHDVDLDLATIPPFEDIMVPISVVLRNNRDFDSEELIAYELGYRLQWSPTLLFDLAAFYNDYDDLKTNTLRAPALVDAGVDPAHLVLPVVATNDTEGEAYGVELVANWRPFAALTLSSAYSFLDIELRGPPSDVAIEAETAEGESPHHQLNLRSLWNPTEAVDLDASLSYVDALPAFDVHGYWRLDLRAAWRVRAGLEFSVVGQNLLDGGHREFSEPTELNTTEVQRSVYGKVTWRY